MSYLIGIDIGTTSARALIIDALGNPVATAANDYPMATPQPLWAEQNPADWWQAVCQAVPRAIHMAGIQAQEIRAVGLTGQMHGMVLLDESGEVVRPCIMWNDQRTAEECAWIMDTFGRERFLEITRNPALPGFTAPKLVWMRRHESDHYARARHLLLPKDYIRYRLTGDYATEVSDASGTVLLDVAKRAWSGELLDKLEIPREWIPHCVESPVITGTVSAVAAQATGLPAGVPVVGGGGDQAASAIGNGIVEPGLVSVTLGTSGVVFAYADEPSSDPQGRLHTFCHAVPGKWHMMGVALSSGGSLRWLRDTLAHSEVHVASLTGQDAYELITAEAAQAPAGSDGLLFTPYLTGERAPHADPTVRGTFFGLTVRHDRRHMARAVLEGVAYSLRDSLEIFRELGISIREVRGGGGGARSLLWRQILADVFGTELTTVNVTDSTVYGAALLAAVGAGTFGSVPEACRVAVRVVERTAPNESQRRVYESYYPVYRSLYPALKASYDQLAAISTF
ncbi:MAG: xylulokinase [Chloroflexi bacterium]|nr:xylulokinase [Chloroflexota bacterium]